MRYGDNKFVSNPGSPLHVLYTPKVDKNGSITLVEAGVQNTDEVIQSYAESTDIHVLIQRIQNGELELLNARQGQYGDFTNMPNTFGEFLQLQIDSKRLFWSLPLEVRSKFDNDLNKFLAQSGTLDWYKQIESVLPSDVKKQIFPENNVDSPVTDSPVSEVKE